MSDPVTEFLRLAESLEDHELLERTERFLREQQSDLNTLAVLEKRPDDQPVALLKIADGEATLFSVRQSEGRSLIHETYIGKIYGATITQVHAIADAERTERVENRRIAARWHYQSRVLHNRRTRGAHGGSSGSRGPTIMTFPNLPMP